jgi:hypothetical protein
MPPIRKEEGRKDRGENGYDVRRSIEKRRKDTRY